MMLRSFCVLVLSSTLACASATPAAVAPAPAAPAAFDPAWLIGAWVAEQSTTPFGPLPIGFEFRREADGGVRARSEASPDQYIELHFHRHADGRWLLRETAAFPGVGVQTHLLAPAATDRPGASEWRDTEHPEMLAVRLTPRGERAVVMEVVLRGEPHVRFDLARVGE